MKRLFPPVFILCALLANIVTRLRYAQFIDSWTPESSYSTSQPLELFALLGVPVGLLLFWTMWKPNQEHREMLSIWRRRSGNVVLIVTMLFWFRYIYWGLYCGWVSGTPVDDHLVWLQRSHAMFNDAFATLLVGGMLAFWLKGIRMPTPHE